MSPTSRTLQYLRDEGWTVGIVERFLGFAGKHGKRQDLFGIIDIIAINKTNTLGVQSCGQSFSEHDKKILDSDYARLWLQGNRELMLIGWRKVKLRRGGKAMRWTPRIKHYTREDFK